MGGSNGSAQRRKSGGTGDGGGEQGGRLERGLAEDRGVSAKRHGVVGWVFARLEGVGGHVGPAAKDNVGFFGAEAVGKDEVRVGVDRLLEGAVDVGFVLKGGQKQISQVKRRAREVV